MVAQAMAQEAICALRRKIARIEGVPPERLEAQPGVRAGGEECLPTGAAGLDRILGGGLPRAALTEIISPATRDGAAAAGFALGLASRLLRDKPLPLLWIGTSEIFREAGFPYPPALEQVFGIAAEKLLLGSAAKLTDALWMAEEASVLPHIGAVLLELRGNPDRLDLTATRRLHRRAHNAGRPVFLIRQGAEPEPTAAPLRLAVAGAAAAARPTLAGPLETSIGRPAFSVAISRFRGVPARQFIVEWSRDDFAFQEGRKQDHGRLVPLSRPGKGVAAASGTILAFPQGAASATGSQPPRRQRATRLRSG